MRLGAGVVADVASPAAARGAESLGSRVPGVEPGVLRGPLVERSRSAVAESSAEGLGSEPTVSDSDGRTLRRSARLAAKR